MFYCKPLCDSLLGRSTWKEGNVLFKDALSTFYLRLYGVGHVVKDHSDSETGNPLPPHRLLFPISSKGSSIHTSRGAGLERKIALRVHHEGSIQRPIAL